MDVRIGVTHNQKEIDVELDDDVDRDDLKKRIDAAIADTDSVLWLTDRRGRDVAVPAAKVAYVELAGPDGDRRVGFGS